MKHQAFLAVAAVFLLAEAPGHAQAAGEPPRLQDAPGDEEIVVTGDKAEPEKRDRDKKVCKRQVATGSIMPKVTCRTVGEWEEVTAKSVEAVEKLKTEREMRKHVQAMREAGGG